MAEQKSSGESHHTLPCSPFEAIQWKNRAYVLLREQDHTIPDEVLDWMFDVVGERITGKIEPVKLDHYLEVDGEIINDYIEKIKDLREEIAEHHRLHQELNLILHPAGDGPEKPSLCDLVAYVRKDLSDLARNERRFPMQDGPDIPWSLAEEIYLVYSELYGTDQTLERLAERGGFGWAEIPILMEQKKKRDRR